MMESRLGSGSGYTFVTVSRSGSESGCAFVTVSRSGSGSGWTFLMLSRPGSGSGLSSVFSLRKSRRRNLPDDERLPMKMRPLKQSGLVLISAPNLINGQKWTVDRGGHVVEDVHAGD